MPLRFTPHPLNSAAPTKVTEIERPVNRFADHSPAWHHLLRVLPREFLIIDAHGVIHHVDQSLAALTGRAADDLIGQQIETLVPPSRQLERRQTRNEFIGDSKAQAEVRSLPLTLALHGGGELEVNMALVSLALEGASWHVAARHTPDEPGATESNPGETTLSAIAARLAAAVALAESEERFHLAFEGNMSPMFFTDPEDRIIDANDAFCQMIGRTRGEILGRDSTSFTHPEDQGASDETNGRTLSGEGGQTRFVMRYVHTDGHVIFVEVSRSQARDAAGRTLYYVVSERDITEERTLSAQLSHQALHDPLTGLANRALFEDRLSHAHARVLRHGGLGAVFLLDLDGFKGVNDTHGHLVGDQLLAEVARRLEQVTRSSDTLCRFGGDEFLYLAEGLSSTAQAEQVATRLLTALAKPFSIAGQTLEQNVSIGVGVWDATSTDPTDVIHNADTAMYAAKSQGKGCFVVFVAGVHGDTARRFALTDELRLALRSGDLSMHFQPIIDLVTTGVVGFEALMRWQHPEQGSIPPEVFIPLAEQSELIIELGTFALREAVAAAISWEPIGDQSMRPYVSVNLSARQFHNPNFISVIEETLRSSGLPSDRLVVEITESIALLDIPETLSVMEQLSRLGIGIALDDFGTGFASLSYLLLLHPNIIKIDQSFVSPTFDNPDNDTLTEAIVLLGHKLGITMLAEGIETTEQFERFRTLGCELGQGFLFSPAVPASDAADVIRRLAGN